MMAPDLRDCCQQAAIDGLTPEEHYSVCDARREDPDTGALFGLPDEPQQGGLLL